MKKQTLKISSKDNIKRLSRLSGLYEYQVKKLLVSLCQCIVNDLAKGMDVQVLSLGKFYLKKRPAKSMFNPYHQKIMEYDAAYIPSFRWGKRAYDFIQSESKRNLGD